MWHSWRARPGRPSGTPAEPLKTEMSKTPVPGADTLVTEISQEVLKHPNAATVLAYPDGSQVGPWQLQRAWRDARETVDGLPEEFRFQDLQH
jgi:hypothetical protein